MIFCGFQENLLPSYMASLFVWAPVRLNMRKSASGFGCQINTLLCLYFTLFQTMQFFSNNEIIKLSFGLLLTVHVFDIVLLMI